MEMKYSPGYRVKQLRLSRGMTQKQVCGVAGISESGLSKIENGRDRLGPARAMKLARLFDVPLETLWRE